MKHALFLLLLFASAAAWPQAQPVRSLLEARQQNVVVQQWETSCGAAALATVMTYQLGHPVTEKQVASSMLRTVAPEVVRQRGGFSLLDMKRYAEGRGFRANGYADMTLRQLARSAPMIVPVNLDGYDHFVVFRGVRGGRVVLADPAFGNRSVPLERFERAWHGRIGFLVHAPGNSEAANLLVASDADLLEVADQAVWVAGEQDLPPPLEDWQLARLSFNEALGTTFHMTALTAAGARLSDPTPLVGAGALAPALPASVAAGRQPAVPSATGVASAADSATARAASMVVTRSSSTASGALDTASSAVTATVRRTADAVDAPARVVSTIRNTTASTVRSAEPVVSRTASTASTTTRAVTATVRRTTEAAEAPSRVVSTIGNAAATPTVRSTEAVVSRTTSTASSALSTTTRAVPAKVRRTTEAVQAPSRVVGTIGNAATTSTVRSAEPVVRRTTSTASRVLDTSSAVRPNTEETGARVAMPRAAPRASAREVSTQVTVAPAARVAAARPATPASLPRIR